MLSVMLGFYNESLETMLVPTKVFILKKVLTVCWSHLTSYDELYFQNQNSMDRLLSKLTNKIT